MPTSPPVATPATTIEIDGPRCLINGRPTYAGATWRGRSVAGLLLNARMIQAVFDDLNPETAPACTYPDTGLWDPERNTTEFCAALPEYRRHGLLAVTVGLQGGGSVFRPELYDHYLCSAYEPTGEFRPAFFDRLRRVLAAADACGMVVIVNYWYQKQIRRMASEAVVEQVTERVTDWLLATGYRNIIVDVVNEAGDMWHIPQIGRERIHRLIEIVQTTTRNGRRLLAGSSCGGGQYPSGRWAAVEDFSMPHGNGCTTDKFRAMLREFKNTDDYRSRPRPVVVNEDSIIVANLEAAVEEGCSWGYYSQGFGSNYRDLTDWKLHPRESRVEDLSGYQTLPVNWTINTDEKRAFFGKVLEITEGR